LKVIFTANPGADEVSTGIHGDGAAMNVLNHRLAMDLPETLGGAIT